MKIAVLSDIHGNRYALEAVLNDIKREAIEDLFILGDIVGYYYSPEEVLRMLEPFRTRIIKGNHEDILDDVLNGRSNKDTIRMKYGSGISMALKKLSRQQINSLISLPASMQITIHEIRFMLCHGSPWSTNYYVYPDASDKVLDKCVFNLDVDFLLLGHTHRPFINNRGGIVILNPGSVGQPRDQNQGASWAIIDTENRSILFKKTQYDKTLLLNEINQQDPDIPYLKNVLIRE